MPEHAVTRSAFPSLKDAEWLKRPETVRVFAALNTDGAMTRAVGGAVRNALLGLPVTEVDLATTALPEKVIALARKADLKAVPTGIEHGTVTVVADGVPFEVTTLRRDVETFGRHATVAFTEDWEEDARRRDFTLNALYAGGDGAVFDPLNGYPDLMAGRVRFIGDAEARIREDYLRILRFFRFNAYYGNGQLDPQGLQASVRLRAGLDQLSAERVGAELNRLLVAPQAKQAVEALFDYGLLPGLLGSVPRLERLNRLIAIQEALALAADATVRLAALAVFVEEDAERLAARLRLSNTEQAVLALGVADHATSELPADGAAKRALYRFGLNTFTARVLIAWADSGASPNDQNWREALTLAERWQAPSLPLRGSDIMALGLEGPEIGAMLRRLEADWIVGGFADDREQLLAKARELARSR
jgi:tRNA nucleotidyltransferase/poly(A) polymerase